MERDTFLKEVLMNRLPATTVVAALLLAGPAARPALRSAAPDACSLLTEADVSKALEVTSLPGKRVIASSPKSCIWSDDANTGIDHRRVTAQMVAIIGFQMFKTHSGPITIEPVSGIGDEAYYQISKSDSPGLNVRKGNVAFQVRILNGLKLKPFTLAEEKAKEADLAKAAVARL